MVRIVVFDRDGTLIEHVPYLSEPSRVVLSKDARVSLKRLIEAGVSLCMHTNQSGVGRGFYGVEAVAACNARMLELLNFGPELFHRVCIAPEAPGALGGYRKPSAKFAIELLEEFKVPPTNIVYVGDREVDLRTALNAGVGGIGVCTGLVDLRKEVQPYPELTKMPIVSSLTHAVDLILGE